jgi:predicted amidohydrolase
MRVALLQMGAVTGDVPANLGRLAKAAEQAAARGADLLIAPELATTGYGAGEALHTLAEPASGAQISALSGIAARTRIGILAGFAEREAGRLYNSAAFVSGRAAPVIYRKSHLYGDYEKALFTPGEPAAVTVDWRGLKLGMLICYDVEFPENVRRLAMAGAHLVAVPTALPEVPEARLIARQMIPVRAFENQIFSAYANHTGRDSRFSYAGLSHIAAPDGRTLAQASATQEGLFFT